MPSTQGEIHTKNNSKRGGIKMEEQENAEFTSLHEYIKTTTTYRETNEIKLSLKQQKKIFKHRIVSLPI